MRGRAPGQQPGSKVACSSSTQARHRWDCSCRHWALTNNRMATSSLCGRICAICKRRSARGVQAWPSAGSRGDPGSFPCTRSASSAPRECNTRVQGRQMPARHRGGLSTATAGGVQDYRLSRSFDRFGAEKGRRTISVMGWKPGDGSRGEQPNTRPKLPPALSPRGNFLLSLWTLHREQCSYTRERKKGACGRLLPQKSLRRAASGT